MSRTYRHERLDERRKALLKEEHPTYFKEYIDDDELYA